MRRRRGSIGGMLCGAVALFAAAPLHAQTIPFEKRFFNEQVLRSHAQPVVPIYEGWYRNQDGTYNICFGYFNLNLDEQLDIPLGERNYIEPRQYDGRQPTHFEVVPGMTPTSPYTSRFRRFWCAFTVTVPSTFTQQDQVWWTLESAGENPVRTPGTINPAYILDEPRSGGMGELAPILRFRENGEGFQGREGAVAPRLRARVGQPLELTVWVEHPFEDRMWAGWAHYQGPGRVAFSPAENRVALANQRGVATTRATFSEPGEYQILLQAIDGIDNFEFHCCWTNAYIPVTVSP
ncbi:MAG: hypothetical protein FJ207_14505 [Gemmatimonadetes bacterium]|nr:hypothetical protein [Gemmatimonadota bacterium]